MFTVLRDVYYHVHRKRFPAAQDSDGSYSCRIAVLGDHQSDLGLADFREALAKLPPEQREAVACFVFGDSVSVLNDPFELVSLPAI